MKPILFALVLATFSSAVAAVAQDPAAWAAQQATQQAMQSASLMTAQQMQQDMLNSSMMAQQQMMLQQQNQMQMQMQAAQQSQFNYMNVPPRNFEVVVDNYDLPSFSVKSGRVKPGTTVRIKWRGAEYGAVYYSTDGWTPTVFSNRYTGPIPISGATHLQAIAFGPNMVRSAVVKANYVVDQPLATPTQQAALVTNGVLLAGTQLNLAIGSEVSSETVRVGDKAPLLLDEDLMAGETLVAAKGTPVDAAFVFADPAAGADAGELVFQVHSLTVQGKTIPLNGVEAQEGVRGKQAVIKPGMTLTATVAKDTSLKQ
jgi:Ni/Co efflux regulator RcnB